MAFCSDDKSKIHVGEPNTPVPTGVRGRESITPKSVTLEALDFFYLFIYFFLSNYSINITQTNKEHTI